MEPAPITKESAVNLTKWRIKQLLTERNNGLGMMERVALQGALQSNTLDRLYQQVYDVMGAAICLDKENPSHAQWLENGSAVELK